jgi:hypothetical protein
MKALVGVDVLQTKLNTMTKREVVANLILENLITDDEATILLSKKSESFEKELCLVQIVADLLFNESINPEEATAILGHVDEEEEEFYKYGIDITYIPEFSSN